jgi:hypothetical protein
MDVQAINSKLPIPRLASPLSGSGPCGKPAGGQEMLLTTTWPQTSGINASIGPAQSLTLSSPLPVIACQSLGPTPPGKPVPNKRGRKPLTTMPSTKKHIQNLTNQRAFRQRRENYIRNLEHKAQNLEILYAQAQEEIKSLKEQLGVCKKQFPECSRNVCGNGPVEITVESMEQHQNASNKLNKSSCRGGAGDISQQIYAGQVVGDHEIEMFNITGSRADCQRKDGNDVVMNEAAMSPTSCCSDGSVHSPSMMPPSVQQATNGIFPYQLSPTSPTGHFTNGLSAANGTASGTYVPSQQDAYHSQISATAASFSAFNDPPEQILHNGSLQHQHSPPAQQQRQLLQSQHMRNQHSESVPQFNERRQSLIDDIVAGQSLFCEKNGSLCYCEPDPVSNASNLDIEDPNKVAFQSLGGKAFFDPETGTKMWVLPRSSTPNGSLCDSMISNSYFQTNVNNGYSPPSSVSSSSPSPTHSINGGSACPPLPSPEEPEPHWQLQQQRYYSQQAHHQTSPPHHTSQQPQSSFGELKWINLHREEQSCGGCT